MKLPVPPKELQKELFHPNTIIAAYRGSVSQNTYLPENYPDSVDDVDLIAMYVAWPTYYIGLGDGEEGYNTTGAYEKFINEWDSVSYEAQKMFNMLLRSNPNVLPILWLRPEHYLINTFWGEALIKHRDIFSSKRAWHAFKGYADGQFKRMTAFARGENATGLGYMGAKRKKLVERFGFDCKNASHLIRILRMAKEMLDTGVLNVYREHDGQELIDIKKGKWSLERIQEEANRLFVEIEIAGEKSSLPEEPDRKRAEVLLQQIITNHI